MTLDRRPPNRRQAVALGAAFLSSSALAQPRRPGPMTDLLLVNGKFTTLDRSNPRADAALVRRSVR